MAPLSGYKLIRFVWRCVSKVAALCFLPHDCLLYAFQLDRMAYSTSSISTDGFTTFPIYYSFLKLYQIQIGQINVKSILFWLGFFKFVFVFLPNHRWIIKETERISNGATILQEKTFVISLVVVNKDIRERRIFFFFTGKTNISQRVFTIYGNLLRISATHLWNEVYTSTGRPEHNAWCIVGVKQA